MKQFGTIYRFELLYYLKNKIFIGVTALVVAILAVVMFFPRISDGISVDAPAEDEKPTMLIVAEENVSSDIIAPIFAEMFTDYNVHVAQDSMDDVKEKITSGEVDCAFLFHSYTKYTYYVNNLSMYDMNSAMANEALTAVYRMNTMISLGMSYEEAQLVMDTPIEGNQETLGKNQVENFFYAYIMIFALYMVILLYGQMVATNVATEKSSRAMEVLITSAKPVSMMFGKVLASCTAGFMQLVAVFGSALLFYSLNKPYWEDSEIGQMLFNIPAEMLVYMLVFFVLGFLIYAFMFGAVGSTASKLEDINTSVMPITLLFVAGFLVVVIAMTSGDVDSPLMIACSYIPFTSPMAMFTRIALSTVSAAEIAASIGVLVASVVAVGVAAAKIYRVGVLLYGTTPKIGTILKMLKKS